nr:LysR substrate-binding domain-containing protein [Vibrio mexicanus]
MVDWQKNTEHWLNEGKIDMALNSIVHMNAQLHGYQIGAMPLSVVTAKDHPLAQRDFTIEEIFDYQHVRAFPAGLGEELIDGLAEELKRTRKVAASASSYSVLSRVIASSNKIGVFPLGAANHLDNSQFTIHRIDEIAPIPTYCFWHQRCHRDPAHQFVRSIIIDIATSVMEQRGLKAT